jgi:H+-transporting ATPase
MSNIADNQIQFTATDLYDKDKVDIEHVVMEEVFQLLQCTDEGLTDAEATNRIGIFGPNKLEEKKEK